MRIMGIDPGLATVGYGVIDKHGADISMVSYGIISTAPGLTLPRRLKIIHDDMGEIIEKFQPDMMAYEELFFYKNVKTAIPVAQARGVSLIAGVEAIGDDNLYEYTPMQIKQAVCGYGGADKRQVQEMVKLLLKMDRIPKPDDAADALAVAICLSNSVRGAMVFKIK